MSQDHLIKLKSPKSGHIRWTRRNKKSKGFQNKAVLELRKYDPEVREYVMYKQAKK